MNTWPTSPSKGLPIGWLIALMALTLGLVAWAQQQGWRVTVSDAPTAWEMSLQFKDLPNGDIAVLDTQRGLTLREFSGEQGFLRGSLRALARQRRVAEADHQAPVLLRALTDGRLLLIDPTQGVRIDLDSFGPSNKAVFAGLRGHFPTALKQE
jgi:putative photosynthetic complex assembly protein